MSTKKEIRKEILKIRSGLSQDEVGELSSQICAKAAETEQYRNADDICLYMPIRNEVDVIPLMRAAWKDGKSVWLPRIKDGVMEFFRYGEDDQLVSGAFGIPEPDSGLRLEREDNVLVVMPGSVFSLERDRIGYGGGFYDVYLDRHRGCRTLAVCYDFQITGTLPSQAHDIKPDIIVSEKRTIL